MKLNGKTLGVLSMAFTLFGAFLTNKQNDENMKEAVRKEVSEQLSSKSKEGDLN